MIGIIFREDLQEDYIITW